MPPQQVGRRTFGKGTFQLKRGAPSALGWKASLKEKIMRKDLAIIVLAAGKGKRMKSSLPKVLHKLAGRPLLGYVLDIAKSLKPQHKICVLGHEFRPVRDFVRQEAGAFKIAVQKRLLGSADAVKQAKSMLRNFKGTVLVIYGDNPLLKPQTVKSLLAQHYRLNVNATLLSATLTDPAGFGRIIRDATGNIARIVEESEANEYEKEIKEINTGAACFNNKMLFKALDKVKLNARKKEFFLTDVIQIFYKMNARVASLRLDDLAQASGINTPADLSRAERLIQQRLQEALMNKGVKIVDPENTYICWDTRIQKESVILPFTVIENNVRIGRTCRIGPFCHLREGVVVADKSVVGNFAELVRTQIGKATKSAHFCYLGDSRIGKNVNIGAGTVTANFNGKKKSVTIIKDGSFIGSNTTLIAPLSVGKGAVTGAGSVITKNRNVPDGAIVAGVPARILKRINE